MNLETEHEDCVARPRRLLNHNDPAFFNYRPSLLPPREYAEVVLDFTRWEEFRFDSVMWDVDGAMACYPSRFLPHYPGLKEWLDAGNDFLPHVVSLSRQRGLEVFLSFRVNAGQDPNFDTAPTRGSREWLVDFEEDPEKPPRLELPRLDGEVSMKKLDYANPEVRSFQLGVLGELARYDVDGLQLDFARGRTFPAGRPPVGAARRAHPVRARGAGDDAAAGPGTGAAAAAGGAGRREHRGVPLRRHRHRDLGAGRAGRSAGRGGRARSTSASRRFKRLPGSQRVKVYPCHDNHHSSDGYKCTPLPVLRGLASKWWRQGADGIARFQLPVLGRPRRGRGRTAAETGEPLPSAGLGHEPDLPVGGGRSGEAGREEKDLCPAAEVRRSPVGVRLPRGRDHGHPRVPERQCACSAAGAAGGGTAGESTYFRLYVGEPAQSLGSCHARLRLLASDEAENGPEDGRVGSGLIRRNPYVWGDGLYTVAMSRGDRRAAGGPLQQHPPAPGRGRRRLAFLSGSRRGAGERGEPADGEARGRQRGDQHREGGAGPGVGSHGQPGKFRRRGAPRLAGSRKGFPGRDPREGGCPGKNRSGLTRSP